MGALLVRVGVERNVAVSFLNENGPGLAHIQGPVDGNDKSLSEAWVRFAAQTTRCADGFDNLQLVKRASSSNLLLSWPMRDHR